MKKIGLISLFIFALLLISFGKTFAYENPTKAILGVTVESNFPPTVEGPGFFLPDSPFYFLDHLKQNTRLMFATGHVQKAEVYKSIAGERMAELRMEFVKNNKTGIDTVLSELTKNVALGANELSEAKNEGANVKKLAIDFNTFIKEKRDIIDGVEQQAQGEVKYQLMGANISLLQSKIKVEESLPEDQFSKEAQEDLMTLLNDKLDEASSNVVTLEKTLSSMKEEFARSTADELNRMDITAESENGTKKEELLSRKKALDTSLKDKQAKIEQNKKALAEMKKIMDDIQKVQLSLENSETIKVNSVVVPAVINQ